MAGLAIAASSATPFTVIAHLQQGAALDARFGVALDGLLAAQVRRRRQIEAAIGGVPLPGSLLDGGLACEQPTDVPLPLTACPGDDGTWHWMATTAEPIDHDGRPLPPDPDIHHLTGRLNHRRAEAVAARLPQHLPPGSGRYRTRLLPVVTFPAAALRWRGVGDPNAVADLLTPLTGVGARRGTGEGAVLRWEIRPEPGADHDRHGHLHAGGDLGRPVPPACARRLAAPGVGIGTAGLRPPYWHPDRQHALALPGYPKVEDHAPA
jgi:hypothetical protein